MLNFRTLIVEDNPGDARLVQIMLQEATNMEFDITFAQRMSDATEICRTHNFDLIFLDLHLPDSDGIETLEQMNTAARQSPIIVMTGSDNIELGVMAMNAGAQDYLTKDQVDTDLLLRSLRYAVERKRVEAELNKINEALRFHVDNSPLAVLEWDHELIITRWSNRAEALFGWTTEEMLGEHIAECGLIRRDDYADVAQIIAELLMGEPRNILSSRNYTRDGNVVYVEWYNSASFNEQGELTSILSLVQDITERKLAEEDLEKLYRASSALLMSGNLVETSDTIVKTIAAEFTETDCSILLVNEDTWFLEPIARYSAFTQPEDERYSLESNVNLVTQAFYKHKHVYDPATQQDAPAPQSEIAIPLKDRDSVLAVLLIQSPHPNAFRERDIRVLTSFSRQAAQAMHNALLKEESDKNARELILLNRITAMAGSTVHPEQVLTITTRELGTALQVAHVVAIQTNTEERTVKVVAEYHDDKYYTSMGTTLPQDDPIARYLLRYKTPTLINNRSERLHFRDILKTFNLRHMRAILTIPLFSQGEIVASILLFSMQAERFSDNEVNLASSLAIAISPVLENSLLHEDLNRLIDLRTAQLRNANERMGAILNGSSDALILANPKGVIQQTNPAFNAIFRTELDDFYGQPIHVLAFRDDKQELQDAVTRTVQMHEPQRLTITGQRYDGSIFDMDVALAPVADADIALTGVVCSIRDITHIKDVERLKDSFISTVSHELRTPLTSVVLGAGNLERHYHKMDDEKRQGTIARIASQSNQLMLLIQDILELTKAGVVRNRDDFVEVDLNQAARSTLEQVMVQANEKSITVATEMCEKPLYICAAPQDFARIWNNLIGNAIKYTQRDGHILVRTGVISLQNGYITEANGITAESLNLPDDVSDGTLLIGQVEDNGQGVSAEDLELIFTRFYRGTAESTKIPGAGLGLTIVRELLNHYAGDIGAVSTVGQGSIFSFWVPIDKESA